ncbi:MAG TPA: KEOPS complex kinase/ATPase Bud32 [Candidatus Bathyarchaeia archaeon]|jgi:TP53 regulating kinase-like protein|nr:KEOPS complex kinase/ATPase Bud32 [Candidatus Bathyarchaeia archaeon]
MDTSTLDLKLIHRGAEADLFLSKLPPWKIVVKRRIRKAYRNEQLDAALRKERTVRESSSIRDAKIGGARTPTILGLDLERSSIIMTFVGGLLARDLIDKMNSSDRLSLLEEIGRQIGYIHSAGLVHGDLTTSNIVLSADGRPFIIDFGMAGRSLESEDYGSDLHLLQRSLAATHAFDPSRSLRRVGMGYRQIVGEEIGRSSLQKATEIARRGRYFAIR